MGYFTIFTFLFFRLHIEEVDHNFEGIFFNFKSYLLASKWIFIPKFTFKTPISEHVSAF